MRKSYVIIICVLIVVFLVLILGFKLWSSPKKDANAKTSNNERLVIFEVKKDMDGDGKPEKVVFDAEKEGYGQDPGEFSRMLIYEFNGNLEKLVFDSEKAGMKGYCFESIGTKEFFKLEDGNKNGIPEIYLYEYEFASGPQRIAIVEKSKGKYRTLFSNGLDDAKYEDFDDDGVLELYGYTGPTTGGAFLYDRREMAFKLINNKYIVSYDATWKFLSKRQARADQDFANNPNDYFYPLLTLDAKLGLKEKGMAIMDEYKNAGGSFSEERVKEEFDGKIAEYAEWWKKLK